MRVLIVGINYSPEPTGIAPYTTGIAQGLAGHGHEVDVVTGVPHYPEWRVGDEYVGRRRIPSVEQDGVRIQRYIHPVPSEPTLKGRALMELVFGFRSVMRRWRRPNVVICVSPALLGSAIAVLRARVSGIPVGIVIQDVYHKGVVETGAVSQRSGRVASLVEGLIIRGCTSVVVVHERFAASLVTLGVDASRIRVIRNWTHIDAPSTVDKSSVRRRFGWDDDELLVVHTGNMGVKQGLENVVEAARLADEGPGADRVRFVLVGDGNRRRALEASAEDVKSVEFLDLLPDSDFRDVLGAADILLMNEKPGVGEMAAPSKLTSYFASGRPVIAATDREGVAAQEVYASGAGEVIDPGKPEALLATVLSLGSDHVRGEQMGRSGVEYARSVLSFEAAVARYEGWCVSMVEGS